MRWRNLLLVTAAGLAVLYGVVVAVAVTVSGADLLRQPPAYYAALIPFVYFAVCFFTATGHIPTRHLRWVGILAHVAVAPCLVLSFLRLGLLFPILAVLWYRVYQWRMSSDGGAS